MRCRHLALLGVFLLASVIDVRVKAAKKDAPVSNGHSTRKSLHHSGPVAEPPDCVVGKTFPCAIQVSDKKNWQWTWPDGRVEFRPGTVAVLKGPGDVKIIRGELILYSNSGGARLRSLFGDVAMSEGILLVRRDENEGALEVRNMAKIGIL